MNQPPRDRKKPMLNKGLVAKAFLWYGMLESALSMAAYFFVNRVNGWPRLPLASGSSPVYLQATTVTLAAIVFCQVGQVFNCRTERVPVLKTGLFGNRQVNLGVLFELFLIAVLVYFPPLQYVFHTSPLTGGDWLLLCAWPPLVLLLEEARKILMNRKRKRPGLKNKNQE